MWNRVNAARVAENVRVSFHPKYNRSFSTTSDGWVYLAFGDGGRSGHFIHSPLASSVTGWRDNRRVFHKTLPRLPILLPSCDTPCEAYRHRFLSGHCDHRFDIHRKERCAVPHHQLFVRLRQSRYNSDQIQRRKGWRYGRVRLRCVYTSRIALNNRMRYCASNGEIAGAGTGPGPGAAAVVVSRYHMYRDWVGFLARHIYQYRYLNHRCRWCRYGCVCFSLGRHLSRWSARFAGFCTTKA